MIWENLGAMHGRACRRRVAKLYLPPGGRYFGCRHGYGLTYKSGQESHKYSRVLAMVARAIGSDMTGDEVARLLKAHRR